MLAFQALLHLAAYGSRCWPGHMQAVVGAGFSTSRQLSPRCLAAWLYKGVSVDRFNRETALALASFVSVRAIRRFTNPLVRLAIALSSFPGIR